MSRDLTVKLGEVLAKFKTRVSEHELKAAVCELANEQGCAYELDRLKDELVSLTAWQHLLLFMSKGLFGQEFTRAQIAELTGAPLNNVHATCGSVKFIRAAGVID